MNEKLDIPLYEIRIEGHLDPRWSDWLDGVAITLLDSDETLLSGTLADQAALHGVRFGNNQCTFHESSYRVI